MDRTMLYLLLTDDINVIRCDAYLMDIKYN